MVPGESGGLSIVIPVRDRDRDLCRCLDSISRQGYEKDLEVVVIDDGSRHRLACLPQDYPRLNLTVIRQVPLGISAARNRGIEKSQGRVLLFIDSDCVLERGCLDNLMAFCQAHPSDWYQLSVLGDTRTPAGRAEHVRLVATFRGLVTHSGDTRYLNTSGLAVSRSCVNGPTLFDTRVTRGEDSLLLGSIVRSGCLPRHVAGARVRHCPGLSAMKYVLRHWRIGYAAGFARREVGRTCHVLMSGSGRLALLRECWAVARAEALGAGCVFVALAAYAVEVLGRIGYRLFGLAPGKVDLLSLPIEILNKCDLISRCMAGARSKRGLLITYATAWTLVQCRQDRDLRRMIGQFDICYADGMGVVLACAICRRRRGEKVTANEFYPDLLREVAYEHLRLALIGGDTGVAEAVRDAATKECEDLDVVLCADGYSDISDLGRLTRQLLDSRPDVVLLAMGQPMQERVAIQLSRELPSTVFWCVGGLFDVIAGRVHSAPVIIRKMGLEWVFRLCHHPVRLARRYLLGIPQLFYYMACEVVLRPFAARDVRRGVSPEDGAN